MVNHAELTERTSNNSYGWAWKLMSFGNLVLFGGLVLANVAIYFKVLDLKDSWWGKINMHLGRSGGLYLSGAITLILLQSFIFYQDNLILKSSNILVEMFCYVSFEALCQYLYLMLYDDFMHYLAYKTKSDTYYGYDGKLYNTLT